MAGSVAPVLQAEPCGQGKQSAAEARPVAPLKVPAWQGSGAEEPSSQYEPAVHARQFVSPCSCWNFPSSHLAQEPCAAAGCTVPGLHSVAVVDPIEQYEPAGHAVQLAAAPRPVEELKVPSTHGRAAEAPSAQYEPAGHVEHAVSPWFSWYVPALHLSQKGWPMAGCTVPRLHGE